MRHHGVVLVGGPSFPVQFSGDAAVTLALRWGVALLAVGLLITALEWLAAGSPLQPDRSTPIGAPRRFLAGRLRQGDGARIMAHPAVFRSILGSQAVFSLALLGSAVLSEPGAVTAAALIALLVSQLLLQGVLRYGRDGADNMHLIATIALFLGTLAPAPHRGLVAVFCVALVSVAYLSSGVAKLFGPTWRNGSAVADVLSVQVFQLERLGWVGTWVPGSAVSRLTSWAAIAIEVAFPVLVLLGGAFRLTALVLAIGFHVAVAVRMGLGRFAFAYGSCLAFVPVI